MLISLVADEQTGHLRANSYACRLVLRFSSPYIWMLTANRCVIVFKQFDIIYLPATSLTFTHPSSPFIFHTRIREYKNGQMTLTTLHALLQ